MRISRSLMIVISLASSLTQITGQTPIQVAFWNIENLFDTTNTERISDDDFTPSGRYEWTESRLLKKLHDLSQVIHDLNQNWDLAVLGLAEIENREVLERLNSDFIKRNFDLVHKESPDERGIDCGLLYDPSLLHLYRSFFIPIFLGGDEKTRDIIEAEFKYQQDPKGYSLYVFVNHWPSRWGGQAQTDPLRRKAAATLRNRIDQILRSDPSADIIVMGDLNDHPDDPSVQDVLLARKMSAQYLPGELINTMWPIHADPQRGTYKYRGEWGCLDQILISRGLTDTFGFTWTFQSTDVFSPAYLIETEGEYAGWPFRMYRSGTYHGGYSDHLPVHCQLTYNRR
ncbi:MAG: endonuclease/exonuclease/phosphatase family protein [Candidatus Marinimicrobia bacterium]|nr:endonuclease/exonuclease/phosphatase family protein [Candidatus Neomarinimicrobiota bacterium]MCF7851022.1 endonuclease/exonuclease/phosphatase family protein [Candidatus Neomarinimicrobiota bacterium]